MVTGADDRMTRLFGTDGIRGVANDFLTPELAFYVGRSLGTLLIQQKRSPVVLIGRDTRMSGPMLQTAFSSGLNSVGVDCDDAGVLPTPAIAHLIRKGKYDGGAVISASHNPVADNGIKIFAETGLKLCDHAENEIEQLTRRMIQGDDPAPRPVEGSVGTQRPFNGADERYITYLIDVFPLRLQGLKVVIDCANGASSLVAPIVFDQLGADVVTINASPNGRNINLNCGSTYPEEIQKAVRSHEADVGFTFDGDADRVMAVDRDGELLNGDHIMAILSLFLHERGDLGGAIAVTPYSNGGLRRLLNEHGISVIEAPAGDRHVLSAMQKHGLVLGGEQSGHVILLTHNTAGDALLVALALLTAADSLGADLSELRKLLISVPQILIGIPVDDKHTFENHRMIQDSIKQAEMSLGERGRIYVRASGTEPIIRILGEAEDENLLRQTVDQVARVIEVEMRAP